MVLLDLSDVCPLHECIFSQGDEQASGAQHLCVG
jgi:hypothetical protein